MYSLKQTPDDFIVDEIPLSFSGNGRYTVFVLQKKDYTTESAIQKIAKTLSVPRKRFSYAGTKDRNATTTQYCTYAGNLDAKEFDGFSITPVTRSSEPISLGNHSGNRFKITARGLEEKSFGRCKSFVNYFGEQRFSKTNLSAGIAILKDDFKKAASLIDHISVKKHLEKSPSDFVGAIKKVPRKILMFYIHSVQSYIWNEVASSLIIDGVFVPYSEGTYVFSESLVPNFELPLLAFDSDLDTKFEKKYDAVLSKLGINLRSFVVRKIPWLTPYGSSRSLYAEIKGLEIGNLEDDELNPGKKKQLVSFTLGKGSYATVAMAKLYALS